LPGLEKNEYEKVLSEWRKVCMLEKSCPWPYDNRQVRCGCVGIALPERKAYMVLFIPLDEQLCEDWEYEERPLEKGKSKAIVRGCYYFEHLGEKDFRMTVYFHIDPQV